MSESYDRSTVESFARLVPNRILYRAVVVDVFSDIAIHNDAVQGGYIHALSSESSPHFANKPRNSIIARIVSDQQSSRDPFPSIICYPFFPPHLCFPVKPGEQVWVISERSEGQTQLMYWLCRIPGSSHVDDLNFTHLDREWVQTGRTPSSRRATIEDEEGETYDETDTVPGFLNGGGAIDLMSLPGTVDAYEEIHEQAIANQSITFESVPRFTKRPGDFVIQGSNNTLICLGEDRGWTAETVADSTDAQWSESSTSADADGRWGDDGPPTDENERSYAGTIDIVAGRGRSSAFPDGADGTEFTSQRVIENARGYQETDKSPVEAASTEEAENRLDNPSEGDPDLMHDASRIYVSMKTNGDANFGISSETGSMVAPYGEHTIDDIEDAAFIVAKSDEVRIIARKTGEEPPTGYPEINGSIRIIKEGDPSDDMATILLLPDGTIQISGSKIFLGRTEDPDGGIAAADADSGTSSGPGPGNSQPWVKYEQLDNLLTATMENIKQFALDLQTNFSSNSTPGYGAPNPSLTASASAECQTLQDDMDDRIAQINTIKSERIFGE